MDGIDVAGIAVGAIVGPLVVGDTVDFLVDGVAVRGIFVGLAVGLHM